MFRRTMTSAAVIAAALMAMPIIVAQARPIKTVCGVPVIGSYVITETTSNTSSSTVFSVLPGASVNISGPGTKPYCVKVLFTAKASCRGPASVTDACFVRAVIDGVEMDPQGGFRTFVSEDPTENAHAHLWVRRVKAGAHLVRIERRVGNASSQFVLDDWSLDVQVFY